MHGAVKSENHDSLLVILKTWNENVVEEPGLHFSINSERCTFFGILSHSDCTYVYENKGHPYTKEAFMVPLLKGLPINVTLYCTCDVLINGDPPSVMTLSILH